MKTQFENRLEAINWIADHASDEGQFEVLREQLIFNHIYTGTFFIEVTERPMEVVMLHSDE